MSGLGQKQTEGKTAGFSLIPVAPLYELARVYDFGAKHRFGPENWRLGIPWQDCYDALQRHVLKFANGETFDVESGLHHLAHATFWCFALMEYQLTHPDLDNRVGGQAKPHKSIFEWLVEINTQREAA